MNCLKCGGFIGATAGIVHACGMAPFASVPYPVVDMPSEVERLRAENAELKRALGARVYSENVELKAEVERLRTMYEKQRDSVWEAVRHEQAERYQCESLVYEADQQRAAMRAERDEARAEVARLTATLPCGHNKVINDDSYGGCVCCSFHQSDKESDEENDRLTKLVAALEADRDRLDWLGMQDSSVYEFLSDLVGSRTPIRAVIDSGMESDPARKGEPE